MNCEVKKAEICFRERMYARHTLEDLRAFLEESKHTSTGDLLNALIEAIREKLDGEVKDICVKIGDC